jgi:type I restriction enzyme S subunit
MEGDDFSQRVSRTKGREATEGVIPGRLALSVGKPDLPAPPGWLWTALSDVAQLESGHTPSRKHPEYWNEGIPWIGIRDAVDNHGRQIYETYQHVSQLGLENSSARLLPPGTVCLSRTASVGYVVVMGTTMATSQDFVNWVCGPGLEPEYLKYVLLAENESLLRFASGTTHQTIYYPEAKAFHALLPPVDLQRAIARILGALDDMIELNRKMNATLDEIARALFKSWFVDFDPVRAKSEGRAPSSMDAETAKLFPSELVESEMGPIPKGWRVESLDAIATFRNGLALQKFRPVEGKPRLPVVKIAQLRTGLPDSGEWARTDIAHDCILENGDVVFSWSGSLTVVVWCGGRAALNQHLFRVTSDQYPQWFFLQWLHDHLPEFQRIASAKATTMGHIQRHHLTAAKCVVPDRPLLEAAGRVLAPLLQKRVALDLESRKLGQLRDDLLPRLLSGEVSVAGAEHELAEAS